LGVGVFGGPVGVDVVAVDLEEGAAEGGCYGEDFGGASDEEGTAGKVVGGGRRLGGTGCEEEREDEQ
jgi:hypothetical protein